MKGRLKRISGQTKKSAVSFWQTCNKSKVLSQYSAQRSLYQTLAEVIAVLFPHRISR